MISEGSCDSEDWSNNAENSALITEINYILKYFQIHLIITLENHKILNGSVHNLLGQKITKNDVNMTTCPGQFTTNQ